MILTWLWKLLLAFRRRGEAPVLAAPTVPPKPRAEDYAPGFINESSDANNSEVAVFGDDGPPAASPGR